MLGVDVRQLRIAALGYDPLVGILKGHHEAKILISKIVSGRALIPTVGKCYEVHFGQVTIAGQTGFASA